MMKRRWVVGDKPPQAAAVSKELQIHPQIVSILLRRGIATTSEIASFISPSINGIQSPFEFTHMQKAVDRIQVANANREKVLVYGDYDVDGVTGTSILYPVLKKIGVDAYAHIPHRVEEGYGLNIDTLKKFVGQGFKLVITVDNGITGVEQIDFLNENGVDTIIVDHHTPKESLPKAFAIISNALDGKGEPNLAACGLAFKLAWALTGSLEDVKDQLDLVTVGTVADLAPVLGDNRILLKHGLIALSQTKRPGLKALMEVSRIQTKNISFRDIAFGLGPRINAAGRMGSPLAAFELLTSTNPTQARNLASMLDAANTDRQKTEARAFEQAAAHIQSNASFEKDRILVVGDSGWHEGVLGIIAARLVEKFRKPAIVCSIRDNKAKGSGRSIPEISIFDAVQLCEPMLLNFGGHAQACGLTMDASLLDEFRSQINLKSADLIKKDFKPELKIDGEIPFSELNLKFLTDLAKLAPFGPGNLKPLFMSKNIKLRGEARKRGKDTLHCWMTDEASRTTCEAVGFRMFSRWNEEKADKLRDIVYQPSLIEFGGITSIQLELEDWL